MEDVEPTETEPTMTETETEPTMPQTEPTQTEPTGTEPTGTEPTETEPTETGSEPTVTGTDPTGTEPTMPETEPTMPETEPTGAETVTEPTETVTEPTETETVAEPTGTEPTGTEPTGTEPTGTDTVTETRPSIATGSGAGTGRRKESVARVRLTPGTGKFDLNGRPVEAYFPSRAHRMEITAPLRVVGLEKDLDVWARLGGGGVSGQAGALRHGIARALIEYDPSFRPALKKEGFLTRDSREKERRKYGLKKARKAPQYSKR